MQLKNSYAKYPSAKKIIVIFLVIVTFTGNYCLSQPLDAHDYQAAKNTQTLTGQDQVKKPRIVYFPAPESATDLRASYPIALLELCSDYHNNKILFQPSNLHSLQARSILRIANRQGLDILWTVGTKARQKELRAIPIPIDRGLIGWRLLLVRKSQQHQFDTITDLVGLQKFIGGQGHDWPDLKILRKNQLLVSSSSSYDGLFKMLALGHIQYFPRSISEIWNEAQAHSDQGIIVDSNLALHYQQGLYFFIHPEDEELYQYLSSCLSGAVRNKDLIDIFYSYYGSDIERANLMTRTIIPLNAPGDMELPELPEDYWFSLEEAQAYLPSMQINNSNNVGEPQH